MILSDNDEAGRKHGEQVARSVAPYAESIKIVTPPGLPDKGDVSDWIAQGGSQSVLEEIVDATEPYKPDGTPDDGASDLGEIDFGAENSDPTLLEPRGWLLGNWFCRQFVSELVGDGATGKTALRIACALALATGREDILGPGLHVFERVPVIYLSFEDGIEELRRRLWAAMLHHNITNHDIAGFLFVSAITNQQLKLAIPGDSDEPVPGPLTAALDSAVQRRRAAIVFLDPLIKTHSVEENNNTAMDMVMEIITELAIRRDIAIDFPAHTRKGFVAPGDANSGRGASAVKDAGRLVYTLTDMSEDDAKAYGLDEDERVDLMRIESAKVNLARRKPSALWFRRVGVPLGNVAVNPLYPSGDTVQTVEPWTPPDPFAGLKRTEIADILTALRDGPNDGKFYSMHHNATHPATDVIVHLTGKDPHEARRILNTWKKTGVIAETHYTNSRRQHRLRVTVNEDKARDILGPLYRSPGETS